MSRDAVVDRWIRINLGAQLLELLEDDLVLSAYSVSTAMNGSGERVDSGKTPRGLHEVRELIGHGTPSGAVFVGRKWTGEVCTLELQAENPERDWMLSRLIWLAGLEVGKNRGGDVDTFAPSNPRPAEPEELRGMAGFWQCDAESRTPAIGREEPAGGRYRLHRLVATI
jgi:hypothetical protein